MSSSYETLKQGWYLVKVKCKDEPRAVKHLENQHFEVYCPMYREGKGLETVLFPGYIFLRLSSADLNKYHKIRSTRGVSEVVSFNKSRRQLYSQGRIKSSTQEELQQLLPQPIPNGEKIIEQIEEIIWNLNGCKPEEKMPGSSFREGDQVCYRNPLFQHLRTTFVKGMGANRGLVLIEFIKSQRTEEGIEETITGQRELNVPLGDLEKVE